MIYNILVCWKIHHSTIWYIIPSTLVKSVKRLKIYPQPHNNLNLGYKLEINDTEVADANQALDQWALDTCPCNRATLPHACMRFTALYNLQGVQ